MLKTDINALFLALNIIPTKNVFVGIILAGTANPKWAKFYIGLDVGR